MRFLTILLAILLTSCATAKPKQKAKHKMGAAPSLDSVVCADVARWYGKTFGDVNLLPLDTPISLGYTCITDFCLEIFIPTDNWNKPVEGVDYTLDRTAGNIIFKSSSIYAWGQTGGGQESWGLASYFNALTCPVVPECQSIECCELDRYEYAAATASGSGQCSNAECPEPIITSNPVSGSQITVPSYVVLSSDVLGAKIYYTRDGSAPQLPNSNGVLPSGTFHYTGPILIENIGTMIRAMGVMEGCTPGTIASIQYSNPSFPFVFSYLCDTPDKGGRWDDFTPNGTNDNHWQVVFTLPGATTIKRLELYELDAAGNWTTGQVWSTDSPINPFPNPATDFACFPLLVFVAAVQQWVAYQSSLGSFGAGSYTWDLYGDIAVAVGATHLFRLDIILGDDTKLSQTIDTTCEAVAPPLCPPPATPTAAGKCDGAIDVTFSGTVGQPYKIFASDSCDTGVFEEVAAGNIATNPQTVEITGYTADCEVLIYVSIQEAGCPYKDSNWAVALPKAEPFVSIATNKTLVDPNESFTISWNSRNIGGAVCGGCLDGQVSLDGGLGCKTGNVVGSQATSQAVCGVYTYTITGCNTCGTAIASVQVEVRCAATCTPPLPLSVGVDIPSSLCTAIALNCGVSNRCGPTLIVWDNRIYQSSPPTGCNYSGGSDIGLCLTFPAGTICGISRAGASCVFVPQIPASNSYWELTIASSTDFEFVEIWTGRKLVGNGPVGNYTRVGGCATTPGSITVS